MMTDCNAQVEAYAYLIRPIAVNLQKQLPRGFDLDDLLQLGACGLWTACRTFDATRGVEFVIWAKLKIRGAILDGIKGRQYRETNHAPLEEDAPLRSARLDPEATAAAEESARRLREAIAQLTPRQRQVIALRYNSDLTQQAAGEALNGISQAGARDLERRALQRLKRLLAA